MPNFPSIYLELQELWKNVVQIRDVGAKPVGPATGVLRGLYPNPSAIGHVANRLYIEAGQKEQGAGGGIPHPVADYYSYFPIMIYGNDENNNGIPTAIIGASGSIGGDLYLYGGGGRQNTGGRGGDVLIKGGPSTNTPKGSSVILEPGAPDSGAPGNIIITTTEHGKDTDSSLSDGSTVFVKGYKTVVSAEEQLNITTTNKPINLSSEAGDININANSSTIKGDIGIAGNKLTCEVVELDMYSFGNNKKLIFNNDKVELSSNNTRLDLFGAKTNLTSTSSDVDSIIINSANGTTNVKGKSVLVKNENNTGDVVLNSNDRSTITMDSNIALNSTNGDVSISSGDDINLTSTNGDIYITGSKNVGIRSTDGDLVLDAYGPNKNIKLLNIDTDNTQQTALVIDSNNNVKKRVLSNSFYETYNRHSNFSTNTLIKYEAGMWDSGKEPDRYVILSVNNAGVVTFEMHIFRDDGKNIDLDSTKSGSVYGIPYTPQHGTAFGTISTYASSSAESSKGVQVAPCLIKGNRIYIGHRYRTEDASNTDTIETGAGDLSNLYEAPRYIISATFIENAGAYPPYIPYTPSLYE